MLGQVARVIASLADVPLRVVVPDQDTLKSKEYKQKNITGALPMLDSQQGSIWNAMAIFKFLARQDRTDSKLLGQGPLQ